MRRLVLSRRKPDRYYKLAKSEGYKSRAAYKLFQIHNKSRIFQKGQIVVDLCGAPGGWSQVAAKLVGKEGKVILVDLQRVEQLLEENILVLIGDITSKDIVALLRPKIGPPYKVDVVIADCSPKVSGHWEADHARQIWLSESSLGISDQINAKIFVCKLFQGDLLAEFLNKTKKIYPRIKLHKPTASRKQSAELYMIAKKH